MIHKITAIITATIIIWAGIIFSQAYAASHQDITGACLTLSDYAEAVATSRDMGIPREMAIQATMGEVSPQSAEGRIFLSVIDATYKYPTLRPEQLRRVAYRACISALEQ